MGKQAQGASTMGKKDPWFQNIVLQLRVSTYSKQKKKKGRKQSQHTSFGLGVFFFFILMLNKDYL